MFWEFFNLFYWIKCHFRDLPKAFQEDLVKDLDDYKTLCILSRLQKLKNERS